MDGRYYMRACTGEEVVSSFCEWYCCKNCPDVYFCKYRCGRLDDCED